MSADVPSRMGGLDHRLNTPERRNHTNHFTRRHSTPTERLSTPQQRFRATPTPIEGVVVVASDQLVVDFESSRPSSRPPPAPSPRRLQQQRSLSTSGGVVGFETNPTASEDAFRRESSGSMGIPSLELSKRKLVVPIPPMYRGAGGGRDGGGDTNSSTMSASHRRSIYTGKYDMPEPATGLEPEKRGEPDVTIPQAFEINEGAPGEGSVHRSSTQTFAGRGFCSLDARMSSIIAPTLADTATSNNSNIIGSQRFSTRASVSFQQRGESDTSHSRQSSVTMKRVSVVAPSTHCTTKSHQEGGSSSRALSLSNRGRDRSPSESSTNIQRAVAGMPGEGDKLRLLFTEALRKGDQEAIILVSSSTANKVHLGNKPPIASLHGSLSLNASSVTCTSPSGQHRGGERVILGDDLNLEAHQNNEASMVPNAEGGPPFRLQSSSFSPDASPPRPPPHQELLTNVSGAFQEQRTGPPTVEIPVGILEKIQRDPSSFLNEFYTEDELAVRQRRHKETLAARGVRLWGGALGETPTGGNAAGEDGMKATTKPITSVLSAKYQEECDVLGVPVAGSKAHEDKVRRQALLACHDRSLLSTKKSQSSGAANAHLGSGFTFSKSAPIQPDDLYQRLPGDRFSDSEGEDAGDGESTSTTSSSYSSDDDEQYRRRKERHARERAHRHMVQLARKMAHRAKKDRIQDSIHHVLKKPFIDQMLDEIPDQVFLSELAAMGLLTDADGDDLPPNEISRRLAIAKEEHNQKLIRKRMKGVQVFNEVVLLPVDGVDPTRNIGTGSGGANTLPDFVIPIRKRGRGRAGKQKVAEDAAEEDPRKAPSIAGGNFGIGFGFSACVFTVLFCIKMKGALRRQTTSEIRAGFKESQQNALLKRFQAIGYTPVGDLSTAKNGTETSGGDRSNTSHRGNHLVCPPINGITTLKGSVLNTRVMRRELQRTVQAAVRDSNLRLLQSKKSLTPRGETVSERVALPQIAQSARGPRVGVPVSAVASSTLPQLNSPRSMQSTPSTVIPCPPHPAQHPVSTEPHPRHSTLLSGFLFREHQPPPHTQQQQQHSLTESNSNTSRETPTQVDVGPIGPMEGLPTVGAPARSAQGILQSLFTLQAKLKQGSPVATATPASATPPQISNLVLDSNSSGPPTSQLAGQEPHSHQREDVHPEGELEDPYRRESNCWTTDTLASLAGDSNPRRHYFVLHTSWQDDLYCPPITASAGGLDYSPQRDGAAKASTVSIIGGGSNTLQKQSHSNLWFIDAIKKNRKLQRKMLKDERELRRRRGERSVTCNVVKDELNWAAGVDGYSEDESSSNSEDEYTNKRLEAFTRTDSPLLPVVEHLTTVNRTGAGSPSVMNTRRKKRGQALVSILKRKGSLTPTDDDDDEDQRVPRGRHHSLGSSSADEDHLDKGKRTAVKRGYEMATNSTATRDVLFNAERREANRQRKVNREKEMRAKGATAFHPQPLHNQHHHRNSKTVSGISSNTDIPYVQEIHSLGGSEDVSRASNGSKFPIPSPSGSEQGHYQQHVVVPPPQPTKPVCVVKSKAKGVGFTIDSEATVTTDEPKVSSFSAGKGAVGAGHSNHHRRLTGPIGMNKAAHHLTAAAVRSKPSPKVVSKPIGDLHDDKVREIIPMSNNTRRTSVSFSGDVAEDDVLVPLSPRRSTQAGGDPLSVPSLLTSVTSLTAGIQPQTARPEAEMHQQQLRFPAIPTLLSGSQSATPTNLPLSHDPRRCQQPAGGEGRGLSISSRCSSRGSFASSVESSFHSSYGGSKSFGSQRSLMGSFKGLEGSPAFKRRERLSARESKRKSESKMKRNFGKLGLQDLTKKEGEEYDEGQTNEERRQAFLKNTNTDRQRRLFDRHRKKGTGFFLDVESSMHVHWRRETAQEKLDKPYDYDNSAAVTFQPFLIAKSKSTEQFLAKSQRELQRVINLKQSEGYKTAQRSALQQHFVKRGGVKTPHRSSPTRVCSSPSDQHLSMSMPTEVGFNNNSSSLLTPQLPTQFNASWVSSDGGKTATSEKVTLPFSPHKPAKKPPQVGFRNAIQGALDSTKQAMDKQIRRARDRSVALYNVKWIDQIQHRVIRSICKDELSRVETESTAVSPQAGHASTPAESERGSNTATRSNAPSLALPPPASILSPAEIKVFDVFKKHFKVDNVALINDDNRELLSEKERDKLVSRHNRAALRHVILEKFSVDDLDNANVQFLVLRMLPLFPLAKEKDVIDALRDKGVPFHLVDRSFLALDALCPGLTQHYDLYGEENSPARNANRMSQTTDKVPSASPSRTPSSVDPPSKVMGSEAPTSNSQATGIFNNEDWEDLNERIRRAQRADKARALREKREEEQLETNNEYKRREKETHIERHLTFHHNVTKILNRVERVVFAGAK